MAKERNHAQDKICLEGFGTQEVQGAGEEVPLHGRDPFRGRHDTPRHRGRRGMGGHHGVGRRVLPPEAPRRLHRMDAVAARAAAQAHSVQPALHDSRKAGRAQEPRLAVPRAGGAGNPGPVDEEVPLQAAPRRDVLRHRAFGGDVLQGRWVDAPRDDEGLHADEPPGVRLLRPERQAEGTLGKAARPQRAGAAERARAARGVRARRAGELGRRDADRQGAEGVAVRRALPRESARADAAGVSRAVDEHHHESLRGKYL